MLPDDLQAAHSTASRFLQEHGTQIAAAISAKARFIDTLVQRLAKPDAGLDHHLDCLARISEIARLIEEDADGFFRLASRPVVARILAETPNESNLS